MTVLGTHASGLGWACRSGLSHLCLWSSESSIQCALAPGRQLGGGGGVGRGGTSSLPPHPPPRFEPRDWRHSGGWERRRWGHQQSNPENQKTTPAGISAHTSRRGPAMPGPGQGAADTARSEPCPPRGALVPVWGDRRKGGGHKEQFTKW